jgi:hypothetical protein
VWDECRRAAQQSGDLVRRRGGVIARLSLLRINARAVDGCPAVKATSTDIPASARLTPASLAPVKSSASTSTCYCRRSLSCLVVDEI